TSLERLGAAFEAPSRLVERLITAPFGKKTYDELGIASAPSEILRFALDPLWFVALSKIPAAAKLVGRTGKLGEAAKILKGIPVEEVVRNLPKAERGLIRAAVQKPLGISKALGLTRAQAELGKALQPLSTKLKNIVSYNIDPRLEGRLGKFIGTQSLIPDEEKIKVIGILDGMTDESLDLVHRVVGGRKLTKAQITKATSKELGQIDNVATILRGRIDNLTDEIVREFSKEGAPWWMRRMVPTLEKNKGKYIGKFYDFILEDPKAFERAMGNPEQIKLMMDRLMSRKDLTGRDLVEITRAGIPEFLTTTTMRRLVEQSKLTRWIADNYASANKLHEGMVQVPKTKPWGWLGGMFIDKEVHRAVQGAMSITVGDPSFEAQALKGLARLNSRWKVGKILPNPATHARNFLSNHILMNTVGRMPIYATTPYMLKGAKELLNQGSLY
ncbi:MAG: hypothetical protein Q8P59_03925, partial [Dehalococcoidia bacterium]|nr:hypothetical protein [Dehalococcoidia bacterium]